MLIPVVADYGHGDLAFAEVCQRLVLHLPEATLLTTPVPAFDTVSAGFCVAQLALTPGPPNRVVFHNVSLRADTPDPRPGTGDRRRFFELFLRGGSAAARFGMPGTGSAVEIRAVRRDSSSLPLRRPRRR